MLKLGLGGVWKYLHIELSFYLQLILGLGFPFLEAMKKRKAEVRLYIWIGAQIRSAPNKN